MRPSPRSFPSGLAAIRRTPVKPTTKGKVKTRNIVSWLTILSFIGVCCCGGYLWLISKMNPRYVASGCESRIRRSVDPESLRAWATNLLARYPIGRTNYMGPFDPPPSLDHIWERGRPSVYIRGGYHDEEAFVFISWGAAAGHWGLSVGSPTFTPLDTSNGDKAWKAGIYFWHQFH
jgi:hypothetical protein